jgi:3-oxoacyl-[acyl-carrier-protein] synthase II
MTGSAPIAVTGWAVQIRDSRTLRDLIGSSAEASRCYSDTAPELLGARGLLNKEPATCLALCAVHRALQRSPRAPRAQAPADPRVAVVASSNFGNAATVQKVVRTLRETGLRDVSALDAPNASSNILASTIAIWFKFGGPNLMVCSGSTGGLDAIWLGTSLLRSGRADRVIAVGAEPDDETAQSLHVRRSAAVRTPLCAAAAAVVLERGPGATLGQLDISEIRAGRAAEHSRPGGPPSVIVGPDDLECASRVVDLTRAIGDSYGALGVLQVAVAAEIVASDVAHTIGSVGIVCGDAADGWRSAVLHANAAPIGRLPGLREIAV